MNMTRREAEKKKRIFLLAEQTKLAQVGHWISFHLKPAHVFVFKVQRKA